VIVPTALIVGDGDGLADRADADHLVTVLPNVLDYQIVDYPGFTHFDFFMALDIKNLVLQKVLDLMESI